MTPILIHNTSNIFSRSLHTCNLVSAGRNTFYDRFVDNIATSLRCLVGPASTTFINVVNVVPDCYTPTIATTVMSDLLSLLVVLAMQYPGVIVATIIQGPGFFALCVQGGAQVKITNNINKSEQPP